MFALAFAACLSQRYKDTAAIFHTSWAGHLMGRAITSSIRLSLSLGLSDYVCPGEVHLLVNLIIITSKIIIIFIMTKIVWTNVVRVRSRRSSAGSLEHTKNVSGN